MTVQVDNGEVLHSAHPYCVPPDGFDPLTASDRQLAEYGLPERFYADTVPEYMDFWRKMLGTTSEGVARSYRVYPGPREFGPAEERHHPEPGARFDHLETSPNWSGGYITPIPRPNRFKVVAGSWTVPTPERPIVVPSGVDIATSEFRSSTWIGIGGHRSYNTLPQIGTSQNVVVVNGVPTPKFEAWWQWWVDDCPKHHVPHRIPEIDVCAGDEILAMIIIEAPCPGDAHFILANQRTGILIAFKVMAPRNIEPLGSTAEWVHERPSEPITKRRFPLAKCSDVVFKHCFALNAPDFGMPMVFQKLDQNARLIRMVEHFPDPHRSALVSIPERVSATSLRIRYREAGP
jgi:Peptidase A4 family